MLGNEFSAKLCNVSDHLVTRSSVKVETYPKALKVRQPGSKADGSPKESAPENWEQIIEGIRYSSSTFAWASVFEKDEYVYKQLKSIHKIWFDCVVIFFLLISTP